MDATPFLGRCRTCRWWRPFDVVRVGPGECALFGTKDGHAVFREAKLTVPATEARVITDAEFGCVQWGEIQP